MATLLIRCNTFPVAARVEGIHNGKRITRIVAPQGRLEIELDEVYDIVINLGEAYPQPHPGMVVDPGGYQWIDDHTVEWVIPERPVRVQGIDY